MTLLPRLPAGYRLVALDSVDSTNDEAKRLAAKGADVTPDGTVVWAKAQTAGRGRRGRTWVSPPGNLYCSLILRPGVPAARGAELGFAAALAICDAVADAAPSELQIQTKWPNDVLVRDRKIAGILLESESASVMPPEWIVLGVGVNVTHHPENMEFPATSLAAQGCGGLDDAAMLEGFVRRFAAWTERWRGDGFAPILDAYRKRVKGVGGEVAVRLDRETVTGVFEALDADGAMLVRFASGRRRVTAGDIFFPGRA